MFFYLGLQVIERFLNFVLHRSCPLEPFGFYSLYLLWNHIYTRHKYRSLACYMYHKKLLCTYVKNGVLCSGIKLFMFSHVQWDER